MRGRPGLNSFTKSEFRAISISLIAVTLGVILPPYISSVLNSSEGPSVSVSIVSAAEIINDSIPVPDKPDYVAPAEANSSQGSRAKIDINSADSVELKRLRGIGNVLSKRIVKFRDGLGGFHSIDQLAETYGLRPEAFEAIKGQLSISTPHKTLALAKADVKTLAGHPYISWEQARTLVSIAKDSVPVYESELLQAGDSVWVRKVLPYLDLRY